MASEDEALRLVEIPAGQRKDYLPLMRLADDSVAEIEAYRDRGTLFGLVAPQGGSPRGMVLADQYEDPNTVRLLSVAIAEALQGRGLGSRMLREVLDRLRAQGWRRVVVSTATSGVAVLGFYQRLGFRMLRIDRDWFSPQRGYPPGLEEGGIPVRDQVWLDRPL